MSNTNTTLTVYDIPLNTAVSQSVNAVQTELLNPTSTSQVYATTLTSKVPTWQNFIIDSGTFSPVLNFGGSSAGTQNNSGAYSVSGRILTFTINIFLQTIGATTGNATITGLPYPARGLNHVFPIYSGSGGTGSLNFGNLSGSAYTTVVATLNGSSPVTASQLSLSGNGSGVLPILLSNVFFASGVLLFITGSYLI